MSQNRPIKRRKVYLDRDQLFEVPASSFYKRIKDHAAATSGGASGSSTSRCDGDDDSVDATAPSTVHSDDDGDRVASDSSLQSDDQCSSDRSTFSTSDDGEENSDEYCSCEDDDREDTPEDEHGFLPQISGFSLETLPGSQVTKAGAVAAVMAYAVAHGLTWTALGDLSKLINFLFGANVLPRSDYMFRKLWTRDTEVLHYFFVCEACSNEMIREGKVAKCALCKRTESLQSLKERGSFFIILDLHKQLSSLLEKTKSQLEPNLAKVRQHGTTISDITNTQCYRNLQKARHLGNDDLTLTINTDGSPVFKSSKTSVWPLQFIVNELPPQLRLKQPVLAGLWFGKTRPNMQLFLDKLVREVNSAKPVQWVYNNKVHTSRPFVLCCSVDAPARAAVQNMVPFNGYFGCPWCLIRGEDVEGEQCHVLCLLLN
ncbi:hypothetical protein MTO96_039062 [Rhipicephalus appendiculatus]